MHFQTGVWPGQSQCAPSRCFARGSLSRREQRQVSDPRTLWHLLCRGQELVPAWFAGLGQGTPHTFTGAGHELSLHISACRTGWRMLGSPACRYLAFPSREHCRSRVRSRGT